jgi:hypothetical protein
MKLPGGNMKIIGIGVPVVAIVLLVINQSGIFTIPIVGVKIRTLIGSVTAPVTQFVKRMLGKGQPAGA